jgi:hypothetical protein
MDVSEWFADVPVLGAMPLSQMATKLAELGDVETAERLAEAASKPAQTFSTEQGRWPFLQTPPWKHTTHRFGYLGPVLESIDAYPIHPVETVKADTSLKQARLRITLNGLRIAGYPGRGTHRILLHCFAQNQVSGKAELIHFNSTYRVKEGESAGIQGSPLFVGLKVGNEGLVLKCRTVNVLNEQDEVFLSFLESQTFKAGMKLLPTAQPALGLFSEMALALTRDIAKRHRNVSVQDFELGLDFGNTLMSGCLAEGAYLVVQMPEMPREGWNWNDWFYTPNSGHVIKQTKPEQILPYNYLVFGISRYQEH